RPANLLVVLLDSLNRHHLGCYGSTEFDTPNLDRFAARATTTRFTNHVTGSLPCMPARHDILVGALDFLWRCWGSIELWESSIVADIDAAGIPTALVTDHPHLFETGGENYHTDFLAWEYLRGHEGDPWRTRPDPSWVGAPALPGGWFWERRFGTEPFRRHYDDSRTWFRDEADYPGPATMTATAEWLDRSAPAHDRWFCFVDEFDPHEPFDTPEPWLSRYQEEVPDDLLIWPPYVVGGVSRGHLTEAEARHLRANYGAKVSMIDHWFGRILDTLDRRDLWSSTAVVVCTDHGHYLGERRGGHDIWGKPAVPQFEPIGHTPLLVHWPGATGGTTCDALTTNVDLHATIADVFGVTPAHRTHGRSLVPLLTDRADTVRDWAIGGVFGNWVQVTDGHRKYARAPAADGFPLSMWSNRWSTMPLPVRGLAGMPDPDGRAWLDTMPGSDIPVIRQPFESGDTLPYWVGGPRIAGNHHCYDLTVDPDEQENRADEPVAEELAELLREALRAVEAPDEQLVRLGLA
ncbi:MAG: sulfatase, partial [Actinomycetota bacterium]